MPLKKLTAFAAALCLSASPVMAQAVAPAAPVAEPQAEEISGESSMVGTNRYLGIIVGTAIVAIIIYILINAGEDDDDDDDDDDGGEVPTSP